MDNLTEDIQEPQTIETKELETKSMFKDTEFTQPNTTLGEKDEIERCLFSKPVQYIALNKDIRNNFYDNQDINTFPLNESTGNNDRSSNKDITGYSKIHNLQNRRSSNPIAAPRGSYAQIENPDYINVTNPIIKQDTEDYINENTKKNIKEKEDIDSFPLFRRASNRDIERSNDNVLRKEKAPLTTSTIRNNTGITENFSFRK